MGRFSLVFVTRHIDNVIGLCNRAHVILNNQANVRHILWKLDVTSWGSFVKLSLVDEKFPILRSREQVECTLLFSMSMSMTYKGKRSNIHVGTRLGENIPPRQIVLAQVHFHDNFKSNLQTGRIAP